MEQVLHHTIRVDGARLHYIEQGSGEPLVFLHGFPEFSGAWKTVMGHLSDRFRTIALDTRGINLSEGPLEVEAYAIDHLIEDVRQAIQKLGYKQVTLVGHDWGGFIAWELAIRYPECLKGLIIINAAHNGVFAKLLGEDEEQIKASKYMLVFRSSRGEELLARNDFGSFRSEILSPGMSLGTISPELADEYVANWTRPGSLTAGLNYYRANKSGPRTGDNPAERPLDETIVRVPTLVIWGEKDQYFTLKNVELLPEVVPDLRVHRFPNNDHWIVHQRPKEVADLIADFAGGSRAE